MSTILRTFDASFPNRPDPENGAVEYSVSGVIVHATGGEPTAEEVAAFLSPAATAPHLNNGGLARFSGAAPVNVFENIRLGAVTRVTKGRWRAGLIEAIPEGYSPIVGYIDAAVRNVRVSACTATYVEVKATDAAGAAADCEQIIVKIERVIS